MHILTKKLLERINLGDILIFFKSN